jgi:hypothetical protein
MTTASVLPLAGLRVVDAEDPDVDQRVEVVVDGVAIAQVAASKRGVRDDDAWPERHEDQRRVLCRAGA